MSRSKLKNKILGFFFLNEKKRIYVNELARQLDADPKNVYRALLSLEAGGLLRSIFEGKQRYFYCDRNAPCYENYKNIYLKTAGLEWVLKDKLKKLSRLSEAYIFGSYAGRGMSDQSDVDLLLVGEHSVLEAQKIVYRIQKDIGREINIVNVTSAELSKRIKSKDDFFYGIFKNKKLKIV